MITHSGEVNLNPFFAGFLLLGRLDGFLSGSLGCLFLVFVAAILS